MNPITQALLTRIALGDLDTELEAIDFAVRQRRRANGRSGGLATLRELRVGDRIRFNKTTHPVYMQGVTAIVRKINSVSASVVIDVDQGKFRAGSPIRVPASMLERVED